MSKQSPQPQKAADDSSPFRQWLSTTKGRVISVASVGGVLLTLVVTAVSIVGLLPRDITTVDSVTVESTAVPNQNPAEPNAGTPVANEAALPMFAGDLELGQRTRIFAWVVPLDAPFIDFPVYETEQPDVSCTPAQVTWLEQYGTPAGEGGFGVILTNTATAGSVLTIKDIRAEGVSSASPSPTVLVQCPAYVGGETLAQRGILAIESGEPAVFGEVSEYCQGDQERNCWYASDLGIARSPLIYNLDPGETTELVLEYEYAQDFFGKILATVVVDGTESTIVLNPSGEDFDLPFLSVTQRVLRLQAGLTNCDDLSTKSRTPCAAVMFPGFVAAAGQ